MQNPLPAGAPASPCFDYFNTRVVSCDPEAGRAVFAMTALESFCNPGGVVQGGFLCAMLDEAMSFTAALQRNFTQAPVTLDFQTQFLKPVWPGEIRLETEIPQAGRAIGYLRGTLYNHKGVAAVSASATVRFKDIGKLTAALAPADTGGENDA